MENPTNQPETKKQADLEVIKPPEGKREVDKPKKRHGFRNFLIVSVILILAVIVAVGATGLYNVPVVSSAFGANKPKDLGIKTSPDALASLKKKIPMTISGKPISYSEGADKIFSGQIPVDTRTTSEEITSWLQRFQGTNPSLPFTDVQAKKIEGGVEVSAMLSQYIKAPIYIKVMINRVSNKSISLDIQKAKIGIFNVPDNYLKQAQDWFTDQINESMTAIPGFSMEKLEYHDGYTDFKGTFPANARPSPKGWSDLLNL